MPACLSAFVVAGLAACAGGGRAPADVPAPVADVPAPVRPLPTLSSGATRFTWAAGNRRVEVRTEAVVTRDGPAPAGASATASTGDRTLLIAYLTESLAAGSSAGAVEVRGTVDSLVVAGAPPTLTGFRYRVASDARGVRTEPADPAGTDLRCTASAGGATLSALAAVREAVPRIPPDVGSGARWRDTSVTATCAGPVLLVAQTVARYESSADPDVPGRLRVTRQSTTTARGQGAAGIRPLLVVASGTGRGVYSLDPATGRLTGGTAEGRIATTITVAGAAQRFSQTTRTQVTVR